MSLLHYQICLGPSFQLRIRDGDDGHDDGRDHGVIMMMIVDTALTMNITILMFMSFRLPRHNC